MEWSKLSQINKELQTVPIKGKDYVEVNKRVMAFRELETNGTISTEIISIENGVVVMKATVCDGSGKILAVGHAYEKETSSFINKTSYIENCETSAVGRALGFCGIGVDTSIASAEELVNAINNQDAPKGKAKPAAKDNTPSETGITPGGVDYITQLCLETGTDPANILKGYKVNSFYEMSLEDFNKATSALEKRLPKGQ